MTLNLPDLTLGQLAARLVAALLTVAVVGPVSALAARRAGDPGPAMDGRLTLGPQAHLEVFGIAAALLFRVTWPRPLAVEPLSFRRPVLATVLYLAVGVVAALLLAVLALFLRPVVLAGLAGNAAVNVGVLLDTTFEVSAATALLNLLPIPPLLGAVWWRLAGKAPAAAAGTWTARLAGTALLAVLLVSGILEPAQRWWWESVRRLAGF